MPDSTYHTDRLILRPVSLDDAPFIYDLMNMPKWKQFIGDRNIQTIDDAKQYIEDKMLGQMRDIGYGNYVVIRKEDDMKLGTCGLYNRPDVEGTDIGFAFLPNSEGKGYATEAAQRIQQAAIEDFNISTINGYTTKDNIASRRVLEKLGMKVIDTIHLRGDEEELLFYQVNL